MSDISSMYDAGAAFYDESANVAAQIPGPLGTVVGALETMSPIMNPFLLGGFNNFRAQNTILQGGFLDDARRPGASIRAKFRPFERGSLNPGARARS